MTNKRYLGAGAEGLPLCVSMGLQPKVLFGKKLPRVLGCVNRISRPACLGTGVGRRAVPEMPLVRSAWTG